MQCMTEPNRHVTCENFCLGYVKPTLQDDAGDETQKFVFCSCGLGKLMPVQASLFLVSLPG